MANIGTVAGDIRLQDAFSGPLKAAASQLSAFEARLNALSANTANLTKRTASTASALDKFAGHIKNTLIHVGTAVVAYKGLSAAIASVGAQVQFVRTLTTIANVTSTTTAELERFVDGLDDMVKSTGRGPQELAKGFYVVASVMDDAATATEVLGESAKLAAIGLGDTNAIARALSSSINAYGKENLTAAQAANQLLVAVKRGGAEAGEMAGVFGRVVGLANELGISFAEVAASIATFTRLGVGADEAVTALRGTMNAIIRPTEQARKDVNLLAPAFDRATMSIADLRQEIKDRGLADVLVTVTDAFGGNIDALGQLFPNVRALAGILGNAGSQAETYKDILREVETNTTAVNSAMDNTRKSASFRWDTLKAQFETLALTLGEALLPGVEALGNALADMDPSTLREFGEDVAEIMDSLAKVLTVVVDNLHLLKGAVVGLIALRLGRALSTWVIGLETAAVAAKAATTPMAVLGTTIGALAAPIAIAAGALLALSEQVKKESREAQHEIDQIVIQAQAAGAKMQLLREHGVVSLEREKEEFESANDAAVKYTVTLADLERQQEAARGKFGARDRRTTALDEQVDKTRELLAVEKLRASQALQGIKLAQQQERIIAGFGQSDPPPAPDPKPWGETNAQAEKFAQRLGEVMQRLQDQLELTRSNFDLSSAAHKQRMNDITGTLDGEIEIAEEKQVQLALDRVIHSLENAKVKLTDQQRANIEAMVRETVKLGNELKNQERVWKSQEDGMRDLLDLRVKAAAAEREVTEAASRRARDLQDEVIAASLNLETTTKMLAALIDGGREAARFVELEAFYRLQGVKNAEELARVMVEIESRQEKVNYLLQRFGSLARPAWEVYADVAFDAINLVVDTLGNALEEFMNEGTVNWDNLWENLKSSAISIFVDMLKEMLKKWLAQQAIMAATNVAAGGGGGVGGGGGWMGMLGSLGGMFGGGAAAGGAGGAGTVVGSSPTVVGSVGGAGAGAAAAGWLAAIIAVVAILNNQAKTSGRAEVDTGLTFGGGQGISLSSDNRYNAQGGLTRFKAQLEALKKMVDHVVEFIRGLGGTIDKTVKDTSSLMVSREGQGKKTNWFVEYANGLVRHFGKDMDAAFEFAMVQAIRQAPTAGLSPEVRTVLQNTAASTMDELQSDIDVAQEVVRARLGDVGADIVEIFQRFEESIAQAERLGLATDHLSAARNREIEAIRNQLLGIDTTTSDFLASLRSFQDGIDETGESMRISIEARIADLQRELDRLSHTPAGTTPGSGQGVDRTLDPGDVGGGGTGGVQDIGDSIVSGLTAIFEQLGEGFNAERIAEIQREINAYLEELDRIPQALSDQELSMAVFDSLYRYLEDSGKYEADRVKWARLKVELEFAAIKAQLIALGKWEEFAEMFNDAFAAAMAAAGKKPGRRGGGRGAGDAAEDTREGIRREVGTFGLSDFEIALQAAGQWFDDFKERIKEAGFGAAESAALIAQAQEEMARRTEELKLALVDRFREFLGLVTPFDKVRKVAGDLIEDIESSPFGDARKAKMIGRVLKELEEQLDRMAQQMALSLFGEMLGDLERFGASEQQLTDVRMAMAILEHALKMEHYRVELELLRASGRIAPEVMAKLDEALKFLEGIDPADYIPGAGGGGGSDHTPGVGTTIPGWRDENGVFHPFDPSKVGEGMDELAKRMERANDMLKGYAEEALPEFQREMAKIIEDFEFISSVLGETAEVEQARAKAIGRLITDWLQPVVDARREMDFGPNSVLRGDQQFGLVRDQFRDVTQRILGGDLDLRDRFLELADQYRELGGQFTGGQGFRFIDSEIKHAFDQLISIIPGIGTTGPQLGMPSNPSTVQSPELQFSIEAGNTMIVGELRTQTEILTGIRSDTMNISSVLSNPLQVREVA